MCKQGDTTSLWHRDIGYYGVDSCISRLVHQLNHVGIRTVASCCGHGFRPGRISLADGREIFIAANHDEATRIDDLFPLDIHGRTAEERESELQKGAAQ